MSNGFSTLTLGTAQLGLPYGIANVDGQPDDRRALAIVETAVEGGINVFDTAAAYGTSEAVLGRALRELGATDAVTVVTKVRHLTDEERADPASARRAIEESLDASRTKLGLDVLPFVLFHKEPDAVCVEELLSLRDRGWVDRIGVSFRSAPLEPVGLDERFTALQVPGNLLDRWPRSEPIVASLTRPGLDVFVRSVFLQGLLVMPCDALPPHLADALPVRRRLARIAADAGLTESELALRYALGLTFAGSVLIGVETPRQLKDNLRIAERGPLPDDVLRRIAEAVLDVPSHVVTPTRWAEQAQQAATEQEHT